jgi:hypothetical protein
LPALGKRHALWQWLGDTYEAVRHHLHMGSGDERRRPVPTAVFVGLAVVGVLLTLAFGVWVFGRGW